VTASLDLLERTAVSTIALVIAGTASVLDHQPVLVMLGGEALTAPQSFALIRATAMAFVSMESANASLDLPESPVRHRFVLVHATAMGSATRHLVPASANLSILVLIAPLQHVQTIALTTGVAISRRTCAIALRGGRALIVPNPFALGTAMGMAIAHLPGFASVLPTTSGLIVLNRCAKFA
jgi:hypothetical protein